jgi:hypothetical protein
VHGCRPGQFGGHLVNIQSFYMRNTRAMTGNVMIRLFCLSSKLLDFRQGLCTVSFFFLIFCSQIASAQSPDRIPYQAVIRSSSGALLADQSVCVRISILRGSSSGTAVYSETHAGKTNAYGQLTLEIGGGAVVSGSFGSIPWSRGKMFAKIEIDPAGGTNYTLSSTTQLLSVPYALNSKTVNLSKSGDTITVGDVQLLIPFING